MRTKILCALFAISACSASAQGVISDVMSGKLIEPEVGAYAWYELVDSETNRKLFMRQAIVGQKKVADKTGYYLETEIMPEIGFPIIYRMLLTGPATNPANVHEIMMKDGTQPIETVTLDPSQTEAGEEPEAAVRESLGKEIIKTATGDIEAERFTISRDGATTQVWLNDDVRPMGIVKVISADGELIVTRFGVGGPDAESVLEKKMKEQEEDDVKVEVGPSRNFSGKSTEE